MEQKINDLKKCGIKNEDIFVVIGKQGDCWTKEHIATISSLTTKVIVNEKNVDLNQVFSFCLGINNISEDDLIVIDGDLIIKHSLMKDLVTKKEHTTLLTQNPRSLNTNGNKVVLNKTGFVEMITRNNVNKPYTIYAGAFCLTKKDFALFKKIASKEVLHKQDIGFVFDEACKKTEIVILQNEKDWININTPGELENSKKFG